MKERVRTLICFARELHGVTIGKSHVPLPQCVRFAAQIISKSHRLNRWNDRLSQSLCSFENATSICALV